MPTLAVNGIDIAYDVTGAGPPVLLICGTGQPAAMWPMTGTLDTVVTAGHTAITFDNRGIAPTSVPPGPYTVEQLADDAIALLDHLDVGPAVVLGASLGGTITQRVALQRPDLVRAAIFVVGVNRISAMGLATVRALLDLHEALPDPPPSVVDALMSTALIAPPQWGDDAAVEAMLSLAGAVLPPDRTGLIGQYHANLAWAERDHLDELAGLSMPALAFAAEFCTIFPPAQVRAAVDRMPNGRYVELPGSPHMPIAPETSALIAEHVVRFLAEI
jgi:pimeloyl-ACP methyl ester carboxylesterase